MRNVLLISVLCGALYMLWSLSLKVPQDHSDFQSPSPVQQEQVLLTSQTIPSSVDLTAKVSRDDLNPQQDEALIPIHRVDPLNEKIVDAPLNDPLPTVEQVKLWKPARDEAALTEHGLLGLYTGWLGEAERLGWEVDKNSLTIKRNEMQLMFTSKEGMLQTAEATFSPNALSFSMMGLLPTLLGREVSYLSLDPPFEREISGWQEKRSVQLPSGRTIDVLLKGRSQGDPPYGPEQVIVHIKKLKK